MELNNYPILLLHYSVNKSEAQGFISKIFKFERNGRNYYAAAISGILVIWYLDKNDIPSAFKDFQLLTDKPLKVLYAPTQGFDFIRNFIGEDVLKKLQ